ncbi:hypothetical protein CIB84_001817 [Bambusicola thoracicus]|uniref:EGF-like domain-containing protein n=1 Tax=Bambusicola thoracicus TaxID=9083 RepID=A0A2P4TDM8_BAMTH|nr:hypothetical protein CIB84_001817 [Bambusicola thoracicus]
MGRPPPLRLLLAILILRSAAGAEARRAPPTSPTCAASRQAACGDVCFPISWLCDGEQQCPDGTDELCDAPCGGDPHVWQCDDGRCVASSWRCDGAADCPDGSDEQDCVCGAKKLQCPGTHHCIPHWELCDRHQDCEDGWDEEGCPLQPCLPGQWQCRNRVCIVAEWKCNGVDDCGDSSDEDICAPCPPGMVRCDEGKCILESLMCNDEDDCLDGTDEPSTCGEWALGKGSPRVVLHHLISLLHPFLQDEAALCAMGAAQSRALTHTGVCSAPAGLAGCCRLTGRAALVRRGWGAHTAAPRVRMPWRHPCSCPHAVSGPEKAACEASVGVEMPVPADVDECSLEYSPCSQLCRNTPGSFSCACLEGYLLRHGTFCEVADNATQLLVAVGEDLALLDVRTQAYRPVLSTEAELRALVYDLLRETYYWLTEEGELCARLPGKDVQLLYADAGEVNSISVDWFTGQLYWASSHPAAICAGLGDGRGYVTVLGKDVVPEQLTVYPSARSLYWVNRGLRGRTVIAAAGMDGSNRQELTVVSMEEPVGLSLDHVAGRLYWISEYKESIETLRVDGSGRHSFPAVLRSHTEPLGLAVFESRFFWADGTELVSASQASPQEHAVLLRAPVSAFTVLHALQQPPREYHASSLETLLHALRACAATSAFCLLCTLGATGVHVQRDSTSSLQGNAQVKLSIVYSSRTAISLLQVGPGTHSRQVQEWQEAFHLQDVDWQRSVLYGTDDSGALLRVVGHPGKRETIVTGLPVCSARVDIRSGNLYWLACNRRDIGVTKVSDLTPRILHRARSSIQHLFLDWQRGALYWLARGQPLQQLSLAGGSPWNAWNETWPGELPAVMDSKAFSLLWSSALVNETALLLWDRRTLALVLSVPATGVQGVVAFVGSELQEGCFWKCLKCGQGTAPNPGSCSSACASASASKQRTCPATPSTCDHHYEDNHSHICSAHHLHHTASTEQDHCCAYHACNNHQVYYNTDHHHPVHHNRLCTNHHTDNPKQNNHRAAPPTPLLGPSPPHPPTLFSHLSCPRTHMPCRDGTECVAQEYVCDGEKDCTDGSDEDGCAQLCDAPGAFHCASSTTCVGANERCDGVPQCPDASDEMGCWSPTQDCALRCDAATRCVPESWLCDGHADCLDHTDEQGCVPKKCSPSEFPCHSGQCVALALRCDGDPDCRDGSDEEGCAMPRPLLCRPGEVACPHSGECVPEAWRCDGVADCRDSTDEQVGECWECLYPCVPRDLVAPLIPCSCRAVPWRTNSAVSGSGAVHMAISASLTPGGATERATAVMAATSLAVSSTCLSPLCPTYGSSAQWAAPAEHKELVAEAEGSFSPAGHPTPCLSHEYPCGLGICLNASLVCSGQQDCADGSDEGGNCSLPCQRPCSQLCYPSPQGPRCWCAPGYQLAEDGMSCVDVDECTEQGKRTCSQICLNAPGTYSCACLSGYLLEPDGRICKLSGPEPMLLVAVQSEVLSYGLRSGREEVLLTTDKERTIFSLDYDLVERKVFWMDLATESISWQSLDSRKKGTLVKGVRSDCIAVDWVGRNLYWTDGVAGQVLATSLETTWRGKPEYTIVLDGDLDQPHSLVLQPLAGMLYWSEVGNQPRLMEATMDGRRQRVLLAQGLGWPTALALDLPTSRLFWLDEKLGSVGSTHLDGTDVKVLQLRWVQSPFAAAVCEGQLYWSERKAWSVQQVDKATGKNRTVLLKRHGQPHGLQGQASYLPSGEQALGASADSFLQIYLKDMPPTAGAQGLPPHRALPLAKVGRLTAVDYMVKDKSLYFAEVGSDSIGLLRLKDSGRLSWKKVVAVEGMVVSLALDWLSGNLYWIEGQPTSIRVATAGGRWALVLLSEGLQGAAWLALCPRASTMCFITAAGSRRPGAAVECAAMDGSGRRVVWSRARSPAGLTFGGASTRLYWADQERGAIGSVELDGSHFRLVREGLHGLRLFAIGDGFLLWSTTATNGEAI